MLSTLYIRTDFKLQRYKINYIYTNKETESCREINHKWRPAYTIYIHDFNSISCKMLKTGFTMQAVFIWLKNKGRLWSLFEIESKIIIKKKKKYNCMIENCSICETIIKLRVTKYRPFEYPACILLSFA